VKRVAAPEPAPSPPRKKARLSDPTPPKATTARPSEPKSTKSVARPPKTALAKLAERPQKAAPPPRSDREKQEDAYIAYLEGKLGWKKGKEKTKSYGSGLDEDGLDGAC
jgi:nucleolar MIF4G domain-containing protein 1